MTTTTINEAPTLITRIREDEGRLKPLADALNAVLIANRHLRKFAAEVTTYTQELMATATTNHCYPMSSTGGGIFMDPTESASRMASCAAKQAAAIDAFYLLAETLGFETDPRKTNQINDTIRYVCENADDWKFRL